ncbi:DUF4114 domain-containing protein [Pseudanabaena biceps]|nr:DUF4114 domain-containing protein [Pseudanabaena biceps]
MISRGATQLAILKNTAIANLTATNVVVDVNAPNNTTVNAAPAIAPVTFTIDENSAIGTLVGKVNATDDNLAAGDKLQFSITGGNNDLNANGISPFSIDPITGEIKVTDTADLDFERNSSINVKVKVSDAENLFSEAQVTVALNNLVEPTPLPFKLTNFDFQNLPKLGTTVEATPKDIFLGGFSGLFFVGTAANGNLKFVANTDRGPNGDPTGQNRPFLLPDFQPEIVSFELNRTTGKIEITKRTGLFEKDGVTKLTGLPNLQAGVGGTAYTDEIGVDLAGNVLPNKALGADLEGIVIDKNGNYWLVDEYRPAIYQFDVNGKLLDRFIPIGTATAPEPDAAAGTFGTEVLPAVYAQRRNNRGFEAVAIEGNKLYAFIQSALDNPDVTNDSTSSNSRNLRILEFDTVTKAVTAEYLYVLDNITGTGTAKTDKIGDAVSLGNGKFAVVERDDRSTTESNKLIYEIDLKNATNINNLANLASVPSGKTIEQLSPSELITFNIKAVDKTLIANAAKFGYTGVEKLEGLALIAPNTFALINDNDFNSANPTKLGILELPPLPSKPLKLKNNKDTITISGGDSDKPTISFTIKGNGSNQVSELGLFLVDDDAGTIDGSSPSDNDYKEKALGRAKVIFSTINNVPNGFSLDGLERVIGLDINAKFRFFSISDRTTTTDSIFKTKSFDKITLSSVTSLNFNEVSDTAFTINFNNLIINIEAGSKNLVLGTGLQDNREGEVIDLRSVDKTLFSKVEATFTLNREAAFNNFIGFYKVENAAGDIKKSNGDIIKIGSQEYASAAVANRVTSIQDLVVANQSEVTRTGIFDAGSIFAPFIIINSNSTSSFSDSNFSNDPTVYFSYLGANSDGVDHIRLLGNNTFGFEDLAGGGDFDYNDTIVNVSLKPVA